MFEAERHLADAKSSVFVLSAFPEFLLDYFTQDFWNSHVKMRRFKFDYCDKKRRP